MDLRGTQGQGLTEPWHSSGGDGEVSSGWRKRKVNLPGFEWDALT